MGAGEPEHNDAANQLQQANQVQQAQEGAVVQPE
jgi:hypothetical protein